MFLSKEITPKINKNKTQKSVINKMQKKKRKKNIQSYRDESETSDVEDTAGVRSERNSHFRQTKNVVSNKMKHIARNEHRSRIDSETTGSSLVKRK